jgi:hypothetical protein
MSLVLMVLVLECDMTQSNLIRLNLGVKTLSELLKSTARSLAPRNRGNTDVALPWVRDYGTEAGLVEPAGIEPATSCLQSRRSPS